MTGPFRSMLRSVPSDELTTAVPLTPVQIDAYYGSVGTGAGQRVGIVSFGGGVSDADLIANQVDPARVHIGLIDGATNDYTGDAATPDAENLLDIVAVGQGTELGIEFALAPNTLQSFINAVLYLISLQVSAIGCSWTNVEEAPRPWIDSFSSVLASTNIPFFNSTGDTIQFAFIPYPASDPQAIAVGGSTLDIGAGQETVWSSSGGGFSTIFLRPDWQPSYNFARGLPDMVLDGDPQTGIPLVLNGLNYIFGGTSLSAQLAARQFGLLDGGFVSHPLRWNPTLYSRPDCFNLILGPGNPGEYGHNTQPPGAGLGSWNLTRLRQALSLVQLPPNLPDTYANMPQPYYPQRFPMRVVSLLMNAPALAIRSTIAADPVVPTNPASGQQ